MTLVESQVRIAHGDVVLLDFGDLLEQEPQPERSIQGQVVARPRATSVRIYGRGNAQHSLSWTMRRLHETPNAARLAILDAQRLAADDVKTLTISLLGGGSRILIDALIDSVSGSLVPGTCYSSISYHIMAGSMHETPSGIDTLVWNDGGSMVWSTGELMTYNNN
jgi:hypothetical protein